MTITREIEGTFKLNLLGDELRIAFPEWWTEIIDPVLGTIYETEFYLEGNDQGIRITVPDDADEDAVRTVILAHDPEVQTAGETLRTNIIVLAQSAAGVALNDLTDNQVRALIAVVLWKAGGIANDMTVRPLGEWT